MIHLILHLPAARVGQDIEGVHQARVATRRLRSDLRTFRPLLDPQWAHRLEEELRWLADDLGAVRDADVLLARLPKVVDKYPELDSEGADRVIKGMEQRRRASNRILLSHLNRRATDHLLDLLVVAAANPMTRPKADDPAVDRLSVLVRKRWRRVQRAVDALALEPPIDDLHRIRILAKRARYAAEAVGPVFDPKAKSFAKSMAGIQDVLGELNDAAVAEVMLAKMAETASGPAAFTAGRMTQMITSDGAQFRHGWEKYYRRASRKKSQDWLR